MAENVNDCVSVVAADHEKQDGGQSSHRADDSEAVPKTGLDGYRIPKKAPRKSGQKRKGRKKPYRGKFDRHTSTDEESDSDTTGSGSSDSSTTVSTDSNTSTSSDTDSDVSKSSANRKSDDSTDKGKHKKSASKKRQPTTDVDCDSYTRFDPTSSKPKCKLDADMISYVKRHFRQFLSDSTLEDKVLEDSPVPNISILKAAKLDPYMEEMIDKRSSKICVNIDTGLKRVQQRVLNVMGPLGKLWSELEDIRCGRAGEETDLQTMLSLVEQSILMLGQANVATIYQRRLGIVAKISRSQKKAKKLLNKYAPALQHTNKSLFGDTFYKKLERHVKVKRKAQEIGETLGSQQFKRPRFEYPSRPRDQFQPFRGWPSSISRGGRDGGRYIKFKTNKRGWRGQYKPTGNKTSV
ncbi:uncharacterized protein [Ptychodera flava]|uniref:uncharacterized protein n=1 Tax=Ptychodera flava TaxID=63121 RepID=UPI003969D7EB